MIHIDGSQKSGSGTIVRFAAGLATLLGDDPNLVKIQGIGYQSSV
jgi:RNA 3'-terminal phosphate cyclase